MSRLRKVLDRLRGAGLKLKPSKCALFQPELCYLGHVVSAQSVATDPSKIEAVRVWPTLKSLKEVQAFLGLAGYYRQFIPDFATTASPLSNLTSKGTPWGWTSGHQLAFEALKKSLTEAPVLGYPDPKLPYILDTDASAVGVGAVLSQVQEGQE